MPGIIMRVQQIGVYNFNLKPIPQFQNRISLQNNYEFEI